MSMYITCDDTIHVSSLIVYLCDVVCFRLALFQSLISMSKMSVRVCIIRYRSSVCHCREYVHSKLTICEDK